MTYKKVQVTKTRPYDSNEFFNKPYNLQNMLITQHNFPAYYWKDEDFKGDFISTIYTDRILSNTWNSAIKGLFLSNILDEWKFCNEKNILIFVQKIFKNKDITGYRIIRYTNMASGYPTWRIDVFAKSKETLEIDDFTPVYEEEYTKKKMISEYEYYEYYE